MNPFDALLSDEHSVAFVEPCRVTLVGDSLEEPYRSAFWSLIDKGHAQGGLADHTASKKLAQAGIQIGPSTLNRHRRGLCRCAKG